MDEVSEDARIVDVGELERQPEGAWAFDVVIEHGESEDPSNAVMLAIKEALGIIDE